MTKNAVLDSFSFSYRNSGRLEAERRYRNFLRGTPAPLPIFMRGGDPISHFPQTKGAYEEDVEALIRFLATHGYQDAFIDIGANIGITTCTSGQGFEKVYCFEPNTLVCRVLKTNAELTFGKNYSKVRIYPVALGDTDGFGELRIPLTNFGGAFIATGNEYDQSILAQKEGVSDFNDRNSLLRKIRIRKATKTLLPIFNDIVSSGGKAIVIKIDTEGFEQKIIRQILSVLPEKLRAIVVFENHDASLLKTWLTKNSTREIEFFSFKHKQVRGAYLVRYLKSKLFDAQGLYTLAQIDALHLPVGNLVMSVS